MKLSDLNLLDIGNEIQLYGAIYSGKGMMLVCPLPDEDPRDFYIRTIAPSLLEMDLTDWEKFLKQSDVLDIQGPGKAILRKSQRNIDQNISWAVYRRDGYRCRYCGRNDVPLTVDHAITWESGGATTEANLITACRRCNKLRGSKPYDQWICSSEYASVSGKLDNVDRLRNQAVAHLISESGTTLMVAARRSR